MNIFGSYLEPWVNQHLNWGLGTLLKIPKMGIKRVVSPTCDLDQINVTCRKSLLEGAYITSWMNLDELG
jgi:hypothetical protein